MGKKDPRIGGYIAKSADFAKPILAHLREVVHSACPEVEEAWKWSSPHFRLTSVADLLPKKALAGYIKKAMELNDKGVKHPARSMPKVKYMR